MHKISVLRPNEKIPVFRVARPYLNILVKPRIFSGFLEKDITLSILKGKIPFKMLKIIFFFFKKKKKLEQICVLPYLIFSDLLPETHLSFYLALSHMSKQL